MPSLIIPIPLHRKKIKARGFNQAKLIAHVLSNKLGIPYQHHHIIRSKNTPAQSGLNAKARKKNIKNAFTLVEPITHQHIIIIDDVITTGATVSELKRCINKRQKIQCDYWSLAGS